MASRQLGSVALSVLIISLGLAVVSSPALSADIHVPTEYPTIQQAIDSAAAGDTIIVGAGIYDETVTVDRPVRLVAEVYDPVDPANNTTVIRGDGLSAVVTVLSGLEGTTELIGFAIENGTDCISAFSVMNIEANRFRDCDDDIDYELGSGGTARYNLFTNSDDDAFDLDNPVNDYLIEYNTILHEDGSDDGIEIRLQDDVIETTAEIVIRHNYISGSQEDGVQIIDYYTDTNRHITIANNVFRDIAKAGIGLMDNADTAEDYRAASITERIDVINNTFVNADHGISGGDRLVAANNIFVGHAVALKDVDGDSLVSHNLFWANTTDLVNTTAEFSVFGDPLLDAAGNLADGSPAIDAATSYLEYGAEVVLNMGAGEFLGTAPDIGAKESPFGGAANDPPTVDAGPDALVTWPDDTYALHGSVGDDGVPDPPGVTTSSWRQVSGPPGAVFADDASPQTSVTFPSPGTYVLRLLADDSILKRSDDIVVTVDDPTTGTVERRIDSSSDDAEQTVGGRISLTSTDLEMVQDKRRHQVIGLRFTDIQVPRGATIDEAWVQFWADEADTGPTDLVIHAQAADDAGTFSSDADVESRALTTASVPWTPEPWTVAGAAGPAQRTPDLSVVVREVTDRAGWASGNSLVLVVSGDGQRTALSFDGDSAAAPLLHIAYTYAAENLPPVADAGGDRTISDADATGSEPVTLDGSNSYDADGSIVGYEWRQGGTVVGSGPQVTLDAGVGVQVYTLTVTDDEGATDEDTVEITVNANAAPTADAGPDVSVVDADDNGEETVTLDGSGSTDPDGFLTDYEWSVGGVVIGTGPILGHTFGVGTALVELTVTDNGAASHTDSVTVTVDPPPPNQPPVAVDDEVTTTVDTAVSIDVTANDSDPEGYLDPATTTTACAGCSEPSNGSLVNEGDGSFLYTPKAGFTGDDGFVYEVCDTAGLCDTAAVTIHVAAGVTVAYRINSTNDDAEERNKGSVLKGSSTLEMVEDRGKTQLVGLRFTGVAVPQGATINSAAIQFQAAQAAVGAADLVVTGQDSDSTVEFGPNTKISTRPLTATNVPWSPAEWAAGDAGAAQLTPDLAAILQEIVDRPGWVDGNSLVLVISGSGQRVADSFDGNSLTAPLLIIDYTPPGGMAPL